MRIARWHVEGGRVRPSPGHRRRGPGRATDGRLLGHGTDRLQRRPVLPVRWPRRPRGSLHPRRAPDERDVREQYADTTGFTDHVFAACSILGYAFVPRIRDLPSKRLYVFDRAGVPKLLRPLVGGSPGRRPAAQEAGPGSADAAKPSSGCSGCRGRERRSSCGCSERSSPARPASCGGPTSCGSSRSSGGAAFRMEGAAARAWVGPRVAQHLPCAAGRARRRP